MLKETLSKFQQAVKSARTSYFANVIEKNRQNPRILFSTIDSVLNLKLEVPADTSVELCESFLQVFVGRISEIRNNIQQCTYVPLTVPETPAMLSEFESEFYLNLHIHFE